MATADATRHQALGGAKEDGCFEEALEKLRDRAVVDLDGVEGEGGVERVAGGEEGGEFGEGVGAGECGAGGEIGRAEAGFEGLGGGAEVDGDGAAFARRVLDQVGGAGSGGGAAAECDHMGGEGEGVGQGLAFGGAEGGLAAAVEGVGAGGGSEERGGGVVEVEVWEVEAGGEERGEGGLAGGSEAEEEHVHEERVGERAEVLGRRRVLVSEGTDSPGCRARRWRGVGIRISLRP